MGVQSTSYPVYEFERKPKGRRRRRISVVDKSYIQQDSPTWFPESEEFYKRVKDDGGTFEAFLCVNAEIARLKSIS